MNTIQGIYLIKRTTDAEGPRYYVGLAVDIFDRWRQHTTQYAPDQFIDKAINDLGADCFSFSILEIVKSDKELKQRETYWIQKYRDSFSDGLLYNISETSNIDPLADIKADIVSLFRKDVGQSIYAVAQKYHIPFQEVIKLRKKVLSSHKLKYDRASKLIIDATTGCPPENWRGALLTKALADRVDEKMKSSDIKAVARECDISLADLNYYLDHKDRYTYAEEL